MNMQTELHNKLVGKIVRDIVGPVLDHGGGMADVLTLTESVLMGVVLVAVKMGGDEKVLDTMVAGVKLRLAEQRLGSIQPAGRG